MLYYFYYSLQLRPSLLKWFIILASCPACFQSPPTIQLANSQPRELALTTHLGANRLVGLSSLSSTNYNKRASTRLLQGQGKLLRRLMVLSIRKRSLTSQLMGLQRNLQCLLISHLTKRTARWSSSRVSLRTRIGMTVVTEMGIEMAQCQVWKIMEVTRELQMSSLDLWDVRRDFSFSLYAVPLSDSCPKISEWGDWRIREWRIRVKVRVVLGVELRGWGLRWELIQYSNWTIYMASPRYLY